MSKYIGHESQLYGVEEHRLVGGKGDGMRLFEVRNGKGTEMVISADRCADISRLFFKGVNLGFFAPCGYVAPAHYDSVDTGFFKSFTAGFLTTCGLRAVGAVCEDQGERLPLHGEISNTPAEHIYWEEEDGQLHIRATMRDAALFGDKLILHRDIACSLSENKITISDRVKNQGDRESPLMLLYHINIGYPLLSEDAQLYIPSSSVVPRDADAEKGINEWMKVSPPQANFAEQCFFHQFEGESTVGIFNPTVGVGALVHFHTDQLPYFTQWKMMGERDYVMGLEPGNCHPNGRDKMRAEGRLTMLQPQEERFYQVCIDLIGSEDEWYKIVR